MQDRLDQFLDAIPFDRIVAEIVDEAVADIGVVQSADAIKSDADKITAMLDMYVNESRFSLALIVARLESNMSLLEVGAGLCFTSLFLKSEGYNITALEPAIGGFGMFEQLKNIILTHHSSLHLSVLTQSAQQLAPDQHGYFDLIFSNNVIEHIPDWQAAITAMAASLTEQGKMIHACPNYSIPYEPHYGVPVFRHFPKLSRWLFLSKNSDREIWDSLNFITCRDIRSYCNSLKLHCCFEPELLYKSLKRIDDDPLFKQRHQGLIANIAMFVLASGLGRLIRHIPPAMATPMIVEIKRASGQR